METEKKELEFRPKVRLPEVMSMRVEAVHERINNDYDIIEELIGYIKAFRSCYTPCSCSKGNSCLICNAGRLIEEYDEFKAAIAAKEEKRKCRAKTS